MDHFDGNDGPAQSHPTVEVTDPLHRYVRKKRLAKGQFKEVYKAFDEENALEVAWNEIDCSSRCIDFAKVRREVELLNDLDHPNVIQFHASWVDEERRCFIFVTELMTSGTLKQFIASQTSRVVRPRIMQRWCRQILRGLEYLHGRNVMHRDLKCDNIFINGNKGEIKIGDLGLSVAGVSQARTVTGTPEFMAPEIYDEQYTNSVDIWSFGMCALEMATGEYPYSECENVGQVYKKVSTGTLPLALTKVTDPACRVMIEECLQLDPDRRPTASQLLDGCTFLRMGDDEVDESPGIPAHTSGFAGLVVEGDDSLNASLTRCPQVPNANPTQREVEGYLTWVHQGPKFLRHTLLQLGAYHGFLPPSVYTEHESGARTTQQSALSHISSAKAAPLPFVPRRKDDGDKSEGDSHGEIKDHERALNDPTTEGAQAVPLDEKQLKAKASEQRILSGFFGSAVGGTEHAPVSPENQKMPLSRGVSGVHLTQSLSHVPSSATTSPATNPVVMGTVWETSAPNTPMGTSPSPGYNGTATTVIISPLPSVNGIYIPSATGPAAIPITPPTHHQPLQQHTGTPHPSHAAAPINISPPLGAQTVVINGHDLFSELQL
jgi:serine/threonine protein kinase